MVLRFTRHILVMVDTDWRIENHNIVRFTLHDLPALHDGLVSIHGAVRLEFFMDRQKPAAERVADMTVLFHGT